jgi:shikimate kinase
MLARIIFSKQHNTKDQVHMKKENIVLIGFTSSGKSAVGRKLSELTGYYFIDLDEEIESKYYAEYKTRLKCREIFILHGQEFFREIETRSLESLAGTNSTVIATGGGAAIQECNHPLLRQLGKIFYLYATPSDLLSRMKHKGLPAYLQDNPTLENLKKRWEQRHPVYSSLADITIDTVDKDIETVTAEVIEYYE